MSTRMLLLGALLWLPFGAAAPVQFAALDAVSSIITDRGLTTKLRRQLQRQAIAVQLV